MTADEWIARLQLRPHPEGGYYRETYRAAEILGVAALPSRYDGPRVCATAIYFLLRSGQHSAFHRVRSDELWHYHAGSSATLHLLTPEGGCRQLGLGLEAAAGQEPQRLVPVQTWFAATVDAPDSYVLVSCTVAPGFDFADFELAERKALSAAFPRQRQLIEALTPNPKDRG